jgi:hypothetical protein
MLQVVETSTSLLPHKLLQLKRLCASQHHTCQHSVEASKP